jgi:hypothetical protein
MYLSLTNWHAVCTNKELEESDGKWILSAVDVHAGVPGCISAVVRTTENDKEEKRFDHYEPKEPAQSGSWH